MYVLAGGQSMFGLTHILYIYWCWSPALTSNCSRCIEVSSTSLKHTPAVYLHFNFANRYKRAHYYLVLLLYFGEIED